MGSVYSADELELLSLNLSEIEDWLREKCPARHADDMADVIHKAWLVIDDLEAEQRGAEEGAAIAAELAGYNEPA